MSAVSPAQQAALAQAAAQLLVACAAQQLYTNTIYLENVCKVSLNISMENENNFGLPKLAGVLIAEDRVPTHVGNKWGYNIEFDGLRVDFEAMAEHLYQLDAAARRSGAGIALVIFEPRFHAALFATRRCAELQKRLKFMAKQSWVRHDEHYHVDFRIVCNK